MVLLPKIAKIQSLQTMLSDAIVSPKNIVPPGGSLAEIRAELVARRDMQAKVNEALAVARAELVKIVTARQELILVQLGIIE